MLICLFTCLYFILRVSLEDTFLCNATKVQCLNHQMLNTGCCIQIASLYHCGANLCKTMFPGNLNCLDSWIYVLPGVPLQFMLSSLKAKENNNRSIWAIWPLIKFILPAVVGCILLTLNPHCNPSYVILLENSYAAKENYDQSGIYI